MRQACTLVRIQSTAAVLLTALAAALACASDVPLGHKDFVPTPQRPIGFCGDGNSWWPAANPPTEWWDGTPGMARVRFRGGTGNTSPPFDDSATQVEMRVLLDRTPKNILWKVPVPGWGDSQPIVVGPGPSSSQPTRIINCCWPHFVVCYDGDTGKELWRDELELCFLPALQNDRVTLGPVPDPGEARKLQTLLELGHAMRHLSYNLRDFEGKDPGVAEVPLVKRAIERMEQWRKMLESAYPAAVPDLDHDIGIATRFVAGEYAVLGLGAEKTSENPEHAKTHPLFGFDKERGLAGFAARTTRAAVDRAWPSWCANQMSSPTSDGEIVVVRMGDGQVGAYNVKDGKRLWAWRDPQIKGNWTWHGPSPRIGRDVVVLDAQWKYDAKYDDPRLLPPGVDGKDKHKGQIPNLKRWGEAWALMGIDKRTGRVRWWQWQKTNTGYPSSTPLLLDLDDGKGGILPVVFGIGGGIYRQSDGKLLCQLEAANVCESYTLARGNLLYVRVKEGEEQAALCCVRLKVVSNDLVEAERVEPIAGVGTHRHPTALTDRFLVNGGGGVDLVSKTPLGSIADGHSQACTVAGDRLIFTTYNGFDDKFRPRGDGMCLVTFHVGQLPREPGGKLMRISSRSLLGGAEAPADLFFDKHMAGFDKMRQINPKKWCGRYGANLAAWFGCRMGGPVPHGERLYIQSQCFLYCIGPAVKGTPQDDPAVVESIRKEQDAAKLAVHLASPSAQYRFEAVSRLGDLKAALPSDLREQLVRLGKQDIYEEIRAAASTLTAGSGR